MRFAVLIERGMTSYGACVPDLPGCVAVATTEERVRKLIHEAVELHIESLRESGDPVPEPSHSVTWVELPRRD